jgi:virginiamycin B lyase
MALRVADENRLWRGGRIPFIIDQAMFPPGSPRRAILNNAITQWNAAVGYLRLVPRDGEANFVRFTSAAGRCNSKVGMIGGSQDVTCDLSAGFNEASALHEIAHAAGLIHEHSRADRDSYVGYRPENKNPGSDGDFAIDKGALMLGEYDYESLMHYDAMARSNGNGPTLVAPPGINIGFAPTLSPRDRASLSISYVGRHAWVRISGSLKYVSIGAANHIWGVNAQDEIFRKDLDTWTQVPGALKQVSVGVDGVVWGVNANNEIFRRDGDIWTPIPGSLRYVAVGNANVVWGINANDEIFRRVGGNTWQPVPGKLKQISAAADGTVWGVNAANQVYRREGSSWVQVPGELKHVSASTANTIMGVNHNDEVFRFDGNHWVKIPGALKQVSVSPTGLAWGVNADNEIFNT